MGRRKIVCPEYGVPLLAVCTLKQLSWWFGVNASTVSRWRAAAGVSSYCGRQYLLSDHLREDLERMTLRAVAEKHGVALGTAMNWRARLGLEIATGPRRLRAFFPGIDGRLLAWSNREVADYYGRSTSWVSRARRSLGVTDRRSS